MVMEESVDLVVASDPVVVGADGAVEATIAVVKPHSKSLDRQTLLIAFFSCVVFHFVFIFVIWKL